MRKLLAIIYLSALCVPCCFAEGLDTLIEVARSQGDIQKSYTEETRAFESVKKGVESGGIKKAQAKDDISRRYGGPVVVVQDAGTNREKWVYKPASSDYFGGKKIYLFFDKENMLDEIAVVGEEGKK